MKRSSRFSATTCLALLAFLFLTASDVFGQSLAAPTRTQCKQWDDAYGRLFEYALWGTLGGTFILSTLAGFLGKSFWWCTAPRLRIFVLTLACLILIVAGIALGPWVVGLGHWWFSGVDPGYLDCEGVQFGAEGLLGGLFGAGVPVISQWPIMVAALSAAAILGGLTAWVVSALANRIALGVPAKVKGEAA